jgi:lysophospholipase L1-like esterase
MSRCLAWSSRSLALKLALLPVASRTARRNLHGSVNSCLVILALTIPVVASPQSSRLSLSPAIAQGASRSGLASEVQSRSKTSVPGRIVFTGSSSIAYWESLATDMKPLAVFNSAFGGAEYSDLLDRLDELVMAYHPSAVVVYAGDNDLAAGSGKTPQSVAMDVQQFVTIVQSKLPGAWVYVVSIKPSYARWNSWHKMKEANQMIQEFLRTRDRTQFIDVASPMFDATGNLPRDLFISDGLHPTAKCYAIWTSVIKPVLLARFGPAKNSSRKQPPLSRLVSVTLTLRTTAPVESVTVLASAPVPAVWVRRAGVAAKKSKLTKNTAARRRESPKIFVDIPHLRLQLVATGTRVRRSRSPDRTLASTKEMRELNLMATQTMPFDNQLSIVL